MDQLAFLKSRLFELDRLLKLAGEHPLMSPNLQQRKEQVQLEIQNITNISARPVNFQVHE